MRGYHRVIPRDFFNEAKLLKCLGRLSLLIHDNKEEVTNFLDCVLENSSGGFSIHQDQGGGLYCSNFYLFDNNGTPIFLSTPLNSKLNYPLIFEFKEESCFVFDDNGDFSGAFIDAIKGAQ
jgi:hypothetical protein